MKIAVISDVHLEGFPDDFILHNLEGADVLILAGDILVASSLVLSPNAEPGTSDAFRNLRNQHHIEEARSFFDEASKLFEHVIYVAGNHEHYMGVLSHTRGIIQDFLAPYDNVHFLENKTFTLGNITFFGATLWTDFFEGADRLEDLLKTNMSDFRVIRNADGEPISMRQLQTLHYESLYQLDMCRSKLPDGNRMVVVTHHAPSYRSVSNKFAASILNPAFVSNLDDFIEIREEIALWVHGHTHDCFDYTIGKTRVLCNPLGYNGPEQVGKAIKFLELPN